MTELFAHPRIEAGLSGSAMAKARRVLAAGPWCWPRDVDECGALAEELNVAAPQPIGWGSALVVAVSADLGKGTLWRIDRRPAPDEKSTPLAGETLAAWYTAASALSRSASVLWTALDSIVGTHAPAANKLRSVSFAPARAPGQETHLEGRSYGLSFALMQAAEAFALPLPIDIAASGALSSSGEVLPVGGIAEKTKTIALGAPVIRKLIVPIANLDEATAARDELDRGDAHLEIVSVQDLSETLHEVWGQQIPFKLVALGLDVQTRGAIIENLLQICIDGGWAKVKNFEPVLNAIELAQSTWPGLHTEQIGMLSTAAAIARRHIENRGNIPIPSDEMLAQLAAPRRMRWLSQIVQQATDAGEPETAFVRSLIKRHIVRGPDAFLPHCQLLGAWARFEAVRGDAQLGLEMTKEAVMAFFTRHDFHGLSHAHCELFRLAGALGDEDALSFAELLDRQISALDGTCSRTSHWTRCAYGIALARLGDWTRAIPLLEGTINDDEAPSHVAAAPHRWLIRAAVEQRQDASMWLDAVKAKAERERNNPSVTRGSYVVIEAMIALDDSSAQLGLMTEDAALAVLKAQDPGIVSALDRPGQNLAEQLRLFYPYA